MCPIARITLELLYSLKITTSSQQTLKIVNHLDRKLQLQGRVSLTNFQFLFLLPSLLLSFIPKGFQFPFPVLLSIVLEVSLTFPFSAIAISQLHKAKLVQ